LGKWTGTSSQMWYNFYDPQDKLTLHIIQLWWWLAFTLLCWTCSRDNNPTPCCCNSGPISHLVQFTVCGGLDISHPHNSDDDMNSLRQCNFWLKTYSW
jgi:hypothetical protein